MNHEHQVNGEDYVLVPRRKAKISRARRSVIGLLLMGTIAAIAGGGTFASFSASTTNADNTFETGMLQLSNTVETGTACLSGYSGTGTATPQADLDTNDNDDCDELTPLGLLKPGVTVTKNLTLENTSSASYDEATLSFWRSACADSDVVTPAGSDPICDDLQFYVAEYDAVNGAYVGCVWPSLAVGEADCTDFATQAEVYVVADVSAAPATPESAGDLDQGVANTRYFQIGVRLESAGTFDVNGVGMDNFHQNKRASFDLTWRIQEA